MHLISTIILWSSLTAGAQTYEKPPKEILEVLHAPSSPNFLINPSRTAVLLATPVRYPPISDLAEPMLRLAGVRINPRANAPHGSFYFTSLALKPLPDAKESPISLPSGLRIGSPQWNAVGTRFAFTSTTESSVDLWVAELGQSQPKRVPDVRLNPLLGAAMRWLTDQETLVLKLVPRDRGPAPKAPPVPPGPKIQQNSGPVTASSTYEVRDVLQSPHDADLFDYYTSSQLALLHVPSGKITQIGPVGIYTRVDPAPDGKHLLIERLHRPYSYLRAYFRFPKAVEVWTRDGERVETLADLPLAEQVPIDGVPTGPRQYSWQATEPKTLFWVEALDGGNPKTKVPHRDRLLLKPLGGAAVEMSKTEHRFSGIEWLEKEELALLSDYDRDRRWSRTFLVNMSEPAASPKLLWDMSIDELYRHPGYPISRVLPTGASAVLQQDDWIYLDGSGSSPEGDRPFLDRFNVRTLKAERLFRSDRTSFESFVAWLAPASGTFITRRETPSEPPNFFLRTLGQALTDQTPPGEPTFASTLQPITQFPDPAPQLRDIKKERVAYVREDGIPLSFTLYLPPGYKPGTRLPTVFWAYPYDYAEKEVAGQFWGSTQRFTTMGGTSHLFFLLRGYAILDDVAMPVVGPPESAYNTFIEQIVANAKAAINKAVELGVTDPERVGVGGHSHGALMTANLLAHCDLFRAGIARSGAYNHTVRPFGFQNEIRTLWQARDVYIRLSPVLNADKINEPLLLIHGELDVNPGTVPQQSEKLYEALRGLGATVRLVMLPYESHGYRARESTEHILFEMLSWFDKYVKNAGPRTRDAASALSGR
ncbi:MAG: S9 family peptidase [Verrucomicrobia bacterium]|nr:S9 family peptidase [Verrucomicrobiota bacterium]